MESKPNTGGPINEKETFLKIHTHKLTRTTQAAYQRLGEQDQSSNSKAWRGGYETETELRGKIQDVGERERRRVEERKKNKTKNETEMKCSDANLLRGKKTQPTI